MLKLTQPNNFTNPEIVQSTFPDNSSYIKVLNIEPSQPVTIQYLFDGDTSVIQLLLTTNALRNLGVKDIILKMPYMPGARCDRVTKKNAGEPLGVKVYADLLNAQKYKSVHITDPHSDVTTALVNNVEVTEIGDYIGMAFAAVKTMIKEYLGDATPYSNDSFVLLSPDAGAMKKVALAAEIVSLRALTAFKERDVTTGKLIAGSCKFHAEAAEIQGKNVIIVDDICSKGGTFIPIAKKLKALGANYVFLSVSHLEGHDNKNSLREAGINGVISATQLKPMNDPFFVKLFNLYY